MFALQLMFDEWVEFCNSQHTSAKLHVFVQWGGEGQEEGPASSLDASRMSQEDGTPRASAAEEAGAGGGGRRRHHDHDSDDNTSPSSSGWCDGGTVSSSRGVDKAAGGRTAHALQGTDLCLEVVAVLRERWLVVTGFGALVVQMARCVCCAALPA